MIYLVLADNVNILASVVEGVLSFFKQDNHDTGESSNIVIYPIQNLGEIRSLWSL